ncbi:hypothetical protein [Gilvibacter sediminis]|uniref:hypothetical protein n=1 Tax=Gilvibacter sediminis TaxID=379071 RepID=UPI0023500EA5|nr:hypothetical protein [Gilvibacter sediminis]MDC7997988.1 hypothetical protein [Gilvibacter sediminis]
MTKVPRKAQQVYSRAISSKDFYSGIQTLSEMIQNGEDPCSALSLRSHLHYLTANNDLAKRDLNDAISLEPESRGLYYDRGVLHSHMKEHYLALKDFCEAVNLAQMAGDNDLIDAAEHHFIELLENMRTM